VRQVDFGLDLVRAGVRRSRRFCRPVAITRATQAQAHFFRFVVFERTGMRLLLGDADFLQYIENRFAFNFQLPG